MSWGSGPSPTGSSAAMVELKSISTSAIPSALDKAEKYRLLNQPRNTESICRDVPQDQSIGAGFEEEVPFR